VAPSGHETPHPDTFPTPALAGPQNAVQRVSGTTEFVATLLHHYRDVLEGIPDGEHNRSDDLLALMCRAWNHPSYQRLETLLAEMPGSLRAAVRVRFERYSEVRVAWCRKCGQHPAWHVGRVHSHPPGRSVVLRPRVVRVMHPSDSPQRVALALEWLAGNWRRPLDLPKAILEIESERKLREAA